MKKKCHKCKEKERSPASQPRRRCSEPGCVELVGPGVRFCPPHLRSNPSVDRSEYHRSNGYFYSSAAWRRFRIWFLRRHPLCVGGSCTAPGTQVDHIKPIAEGGERFDESNCQSLCASCHSKKTQSEQGRSVRGSARREGGGKTCGADRVLPSVQLKKSVRKFWEDGVTDPANLSVGGSGSDQNGSKMTLMTDGYDCPGGVGGDGL